MANSKNKFVELDEETLYSEVVSMKNELNKIGIEKSVRGLADTSVFKKTRKEIAQALTELRRKELVEYTAEELEERSRIRARRARLKKVK